MFTSQLHWFYFKHRICNCAISSEILILLKECFSMGYTPLEIKDKVILDLDFRAFGINEIEPFLKLIYIIIIVALYKLLVFLSAKSGSQLV